MKRNSCVFFLCLVKKPETPFSNSIKRFEFLLWPFSDGQSTPALLMGLRDQTTNCTLKIFRRQKLNGTTLKFIAPILGELLQ